MGQGMGEKGLRASTPFPGSYSPQSPPTHRLSKGPPNDLTISHW